MVKKKKLEDILSVTKSYNILTKVALVFAGLVVICLVGLLTGYPIMWLWNWLMPSIFGLPTINFWKALGIGVLVSWLIPRNINYNK